MFTLLDLMAVTYFTNLAPHFPWWLWTLAIINEISLASNRSKEIKFYEQNTKS